MIKGIKVIDACNKKSVQMKEEYERLQVELKRIKEAIVNLRNEEVSNVCDFIRSYGDRLSKNEIDNYLCHCQNMLYGNIDGIYLTFTLNEVKEDADI